MTERVAVIGAGPSGLAVLRAFALARESGHEVPEVVCFEQQADWGGLWNYTWRTGLDEFGNRVHGSMYRYLWSNGPKECLEFADYPFDEHFGQPIPSFPPREVLADYITGRAERSGIRDQVRFHTSVRWVEQDADSGRFTVTLEDLPSASSSTEEFDWVVVSTGHFSVPNLPEYDGFARFPGRILHSHDYRDAQEFTGKHLLVMGSSYSAEDIALQSRKYGAASVTICYRHRPMGFGWPEGIDEVPALTGLEGRTATFADGTTRDIDAIVLCTGYQHSFPFLAEDLRLRTENVLYTPDLYQGVFWIDDPRLMYIGMQDQYYTFTLFDAQAWRARDAVLGRFTLPPAAEMRADVDAWRARQDTLADPEQEIDFQADHIRALLEGSDYPAFDLQLTQDEFKQWEHHKVEGITTYRDRSFVSPCTGSAGPVHHTAWWEALDDTKATFLATKE